MNADAVVVANMPSFSMVSTFDGYIMPQEHVLS